MAFVVPDGQTDYLNYALSGGIFGVTECNGIDCSSTMTISAANGDLAFGPGDWTVYMTLDSTVDPLGGFQLSDTPLSLPTPTPLPSTWTTLIAGFLGLGSFAYRGSKKKGAALLAA